LVEKTNNTEHGFEHSLLWTEQLYVDLNSIFRLRARVFKLIVFIIFGLLCLFWAYTLLLGIAALFLVVFYFLGLLLFPGTSIHGYRNLAYLREQITYGFNDTHLWCKNTLIDVKVSWNAISIWQERQNWVRVAASGTPGFWFPIVELEKAHVYPRFIELCCCYGRHYDKGSKKLLARTETSGTFNK